MERTKVANCLKVDPVYGRGVADVFGTPPDNGEVISFVRQNADPFSGKNRGIKWKKKRT